MSGFQSAQNQYQSAQHYIGREGPQGDYPAPPGTFMPRTIFRKLPSSSLTSRPI